MAGLAVCLGALALIHSIQNSSVRIQRADRLYDSLLGVHEAITMFELGIKMARQVMAEDPDQRKLWRNPSLHFAVVMLGQKLKSAMDTGLYQLLAYVDDMKKAPADSISRSSAIQAFTLLDHLSRIAPEIVFDGKDRAETLISTPDQLMEIAALLQTTLSQVSYKSVARSFEFSPTVAGLPGYPN
jgi:hypothetical protein